MKKLFNLSVLFLAMVVFSTCVNANITYTPLQPAPADMYDLVHQNFYIWKVNLSIPADQVLVKASLFIDNINNWQIENDILYISLLDKSEMNSAISSKHMTKATGSNVYVGTDNEAYGNALNGYGDVITIYEDKNEYQNIYHQWINPAEDFTYNFSASEIASLNSNVKNDSVFGIGFDPDCHFYNCGVKFRYETDTVPEPATICLLGLGTLSLVRRKRQQKINK
ncbi:MAG: PEP-CTERM sorting domain-containing protein [Sedimentisphaerales bacterium]|nr:PEP-CTERM sorting domain-containing protein [Sedimentisphaerales bacterium]